MSIHEVDRHPEKKEISYSLIDNLAKVVSPSWFNKRLEAKLEAGFNEALLSYSAGHSYDFVTPSLERPMDWGILRSADADLPGWDRFQAILECRNLYRNDPIVKAGIEGIVRRVGIAHPHFVTSDEEWNTEAHEQWMDWSNSCDTRGIMTLDDYQRQAIRECYVSGDMGIQFFDFRGDLKLDGKEADLIAAPMRTDINIDNYNPLGGIVWDPQTGHIRGYLVGRRGMGGMLIETKEIPADQFLLLFKRERRDQMRGIPLMSTIVDTAKDLHDYLNSTRVQARIAATFGVVIKKNMAAQFGQNMSQSMGDSGKLRRMATFNGQATVLNPDEDISMFKSDVPTPMFDQYTKSQIRVIARGLGVTYEALMADYSGMSFSSSKASLMEENSTILEWHKWKTQHMLMPIYSIWVAKRMENGLLPFNAEAYSKVMFPAPARYGIDPESDAEASIKLIASGLDDHESYFRRTYGDADWKSRIDRKAKIAGYIKQKAQEVGVNSLDISSVLAPGVSSAEIKTGMQSDVI